MIYHISFKEPLMQNSQSLRGISGITCVGIVFDHPIAGFITTTSPNNKLSFIIPISNILGIEQETTERK